MLAKRLLASNVAKQCLNNYIRTGARFSSDHHGGSGYSDHGGLDLRPVTMDDYPVPQEPWDEVHQRIQKKYNMQLAAGVTFLVGTIAYLFFIKQAYDFVLAPPMKNPSPVSAWKNNLKYLDEDDE